MFMFQKPSGKILNFSFLYFYFYFTYKIYKKTDYLTIL